MLKLSVLLGLILSLSAHSAICENERQVFEMGTNTQSGLTVSGIDLVSANVRNSRDVGADFLRTFPNSDFIRQLMLLNKAHKHLSDRFQETEKIGIDMVMFLQRISEEKVVLKNCIAEKKPSCGDLFNEVSELQNLSRTNFENFLGQGLEAIGGIYREVSQAKYSYETGRAIELEEIRQSVSEAETFLASTLSQRDEARAKNEIIASTQEALKACLALTNTDQ